MQSSRLGSVRSACFYRKSSLLHTLEPRLLVGGTEIVRLSYLPIGSRAYFRTKLSFPMNRAVVH